MVQLLRNLPLLLLSMLVGEFLVAGGRNFWAITVDGGACVRAGKRCYVVVTRVARN